MPDLTIGTRVVIRLPLRCYVGRHDYKRNGQIGIVDTIVRTPDPDSHTVRVCFPDGSEEWCSRNELEVSEE